MKIASNKSRRYAFLILAIFLLLYGDRNVSASKPAAGLCYDTGCRSYDVYAMQCAGNVGTIAQASSPNGYVTTYLRKSYDCNSLWSRVVKSSSYSGNWMLSEALECLNND